MKRLIILFVGCLLLASCNNKTSGPPFKIELELKENSGQVPPLLAVSMGGGFIFDPEYPGEPTEMPEGLQNGEIFHGIIDLYQYVSQGHAAGFIKESIFQRNSALIDSVTITDEWVDVIFTVAVGEDEQGRAIAFVEGKDGNFPDDPIYFDSTTVEFQDQVFKVMEAVVPAPFEYYNGEEVVWHEGKASLMYLSDSTPSESLQLFYHKIRMGTWTVNDQTFDILLSKESAPPYRKELYTYLYIDLDEDGTFDVMPDGMEAYPVTEPFNIAGESWKITDITIDGSSVTIDVSEEKVDPKVALRPGIEAPNFTATTVAGNQFNLEELQGKYVMLDFWGTWCGPCIDVLPVLKQAYEEYGGADFEIIGIANEVSADGFKNFLKNEGISWPQVLEIYEENNTIQEIYSVNSYPTYYLINPEGEIVEYGMALSEENLMGTLSKYLD
ncbi:TlpA family protein disulfide reductase [Gracilimonas sp. BCB1]|uniref:TlpA family protein disulfide reductase n=1 Tax=Gracilimonas sp. BCB1 TaxID=3152362 RepID=UPI0032D95316